MTEQNPPTSPDPEEPTPTPDDGAVQGGDVAAHEPAEPPTEPVVGPTTGSTTGPTPGATGATETTAVPAATAGGDTPIDEGDVVEPPPPPARSGRGRIIAIVAAIIVVVLVVAGLGAYFALRPTNHKITTPATAGSMKRDTAREQTLSSQLKQAEQQFKTQGQSKCATIRYVKSAVYNQADAKRGPQGSLVFLGAKLSKEQTPTKWTSCFSKLAKSNGLTVSKIDPNDGNASAVCASVTSPQKVAICGWATKDTIGELVPTVPGYDSQQLSKIMLALRNDVEQPE